MHIGSGVDYGHLEQVCGAMVRQVVDFGQDLQALSAGGGLSIPYREGEEAIDTAHYYGPVSYTHLDVYKRQTRTYAGRHPALAKRRR